MSIEDELRKCDTAWRPSPETCAKVADILRDARELLDIFIEGGYAEDGDEELLDRLHRALA